MSEKEKKRNYGLIEPPIHKKLNWELNLIVSCLDYIRKELPNIVPESDSDVEFDLISVESPHGPNYPSIGVHCKSESGLNKLPDILEIENRMCLWIEKLGIDNLKRNAQMSESISWRELDEIKTYPDRKTNSGE